MPATTLDNNETVPPASVDTMRGQFPRYPTFADKLHQREFLKFRLAQAFRIFGKHGYDEGVAGHITVRDPIKPDCFWVNPFGLHFKLVQPQDLLLVDHEGHIQEESGPSRLLNASAFLIHAAIHAARPDVLCAAHSHTIYGKAFSALGQELDMLTQDSLAFYKDHVVYNQYNGIVLDKEEGENIARALGDKKAAILMNHGLLVATQSIEATTYFFMSMERCCQVQLLADAAAPASPSGKTIKITDEEAGFAFTRNGSQFAGWFAGLAEFGLLEHEEGVKFSYAGTKL